MQEEGLDDQDEPEPPQSKEEEEELCCSQEGEQFVLKQEADAFIVTLNSEDNKQKSSSTFPLVRCELQLLHDCI